MSRGDDPDGLRQHAAYLQCWNDHAFHVDNFKFFVGGCAAGGLLTAGLSGSGLLRSMPRWVRLVPFLALGTAGIFADHAMVQDKCEVYARRKRGEGAAAAAATDS